MPFINGRYHVNPIMGQALEAAREAEAALLALQQKASRNSSNSSRNASGDSSANADAGDEAGDPEDSSNAAALAAQGPVHRVEIEVTQLTPPQSGRAARGFVARVHRAAPSSTVVSSVGARHAVPGENAWQSPSHSASPTVSAAQAPETHVFADHGDLVNFLHDALATDSPQR